MTDGLNRATIEQAMQYLGAEGAKSRTKDARRRPARIAKIATCKDRDSASEKQEQHACDKIAGIFSSTSRSNCKASIASKRTSNTHSLCMRTTRP